MADHPQPPIEGITTGASRTWADVERAALFCPVLYQMVTCVRMGMNREQALIQAALWLSSSRLSLIGQEVERLRNSASTPAGELLAAEALKQR